DDPSSTIGAEKQSNPYLRHAFRSDFIAAVLEGLPEAPRYFAHNARLNRTGPPLVEWDAPLPPETPPGPALADPSEFFVVDLRDAADHARAHIPNSLNIALRGRFETWTGTMVPWETMEKGRLILCGSRGELAEALRRLHRVGYRAGIVTMESWKAAGLPVAASALISPAELHAAMRAGTAPIVVDVRLPNEWMASRIGNVINLPLTHLAELSAKLDPSQPVVAVCNSAYRSSMAAGVLARNGFTKVSSMTGGSEAWVEAGLPTIGAERAGGGAAPGPVRAVRLPERISPLDLHRMIADLPGTFELVDIRPVAQFSDYHLPGSKNVDIADLIADPAFLAGTVPLVVVDRDGTLAMAAGGILSQKTKRPIKVLHGGLSRYWDDSMAGSWNAAPGAAPPPAASPAGVPTPAPKTKKRSAGC
ncbi:MAG: MBL fold metallo-hydrolase, partial [Candidatus Aureabacteria bacterium]|nr:MBL fold metallo-hydrolase [Candidatus Auribacterota bacterium]